MKIYTIVLLMIFNAGCQLDNIVRMQAGKGDLIIPHLGTNVEHCSLQTKGHVDYQFIAVFDNKLCTIEVADE